MTREELRLALQLAGQIIKMKKQGLDKIEISIIQSEVVDMHKVLIKAQEYVKGFEIGEVYAKS